LPIHVEDSWNPDDDMRLMKSAFGHRYMITDGWGRDLLPPDNAPGSQAGAQEGEDEQEEAAQEVQLPGYRGWSQGAGRPGEGDGSSVAAQRGGCLGALPKTRGAVPSQPVPSARGRMSQGDRPKEPSQGLRQKPPTCLGAEVLGLGQTSSEGPRTARCRWEKVPVQATVSESGKSAGPTSADGARRQPDAEAGADDGGDDTGMSPAHGCSIGADPRSPEVGGQVEMMPLLPTWYGDDVTLIARNTVSSAAAEGIQPVEPGGQSIGRTLRQIQLRVEDLERIGNRTLRIGQDQAKEAPEGQEEGPDSRRKGRDYRSEGEAAPKAAEALRKGADAARGRGRRKSRWYQRTGARN
jgi:hypothetical protein